MYDFVIQNGQILDGSGKAAFQADIAIKAGKIVKIDKNITEGKEIIEAKGLTVTPGWIDSHSHSDSAIETWPEQAEKAEQGITTSIAGQCGDSAAPAKGRTMGAFLRDARAIPQGSHIGVLVGHNNLRKTVIGNADRAPTEEELTEMKELLAEGIQGGALGLSFGLVYAPGCYGETPELIALAKAAAEQGGIVAAHIRNEGDRLVEAVEEFITVIKESGARGILSHHKAMHRRNWGKVKETLALIDKANGEGCDIYLDAYPYTASSTTLSSRFVPKEYHNEGTEGLARYLSDPATRQAIKKAIQKPEDGDLSWVLMVQSGSHPEYEGMNLAEIAKVRGQDSYDAALDLIRDDPNTCRACFFAMCEEDIRAVLAHPRAMIGTDSSVAKNSSVYHPRLRGTFPRVLGRYVREAGVTTLPEMIRKMTALPAEVYGLQNKGLIKEGYDADLCIFDPAAIIDRSDYTACHERAEGLAYVFVNGQIAAQNAVHTKVRAGKVLLKNKTTVL